jgi:hypothetical protein
LLTVCEPLADYLRTEPVVLSERSSDSRDSAACRIDGAGEPPLHQPARTTVTGAGASGAHRVRLSLLVTRVADQLMSIRNRVPRSRSTIVAVPEAWAYHPVPPVMAKVASPSGPRLLKAYSPCIAI